MTAATRNGAEVPGWRELRHGGLLLDGQRLADLAPHAPDALDGWTEHQLRRRVSDDPSAFVKFVLEEVCGFGPGTGTWTQGSKVGSEWGRRAPTGEVVKPRQLWQASTGAHLPVFMEPGLRVGIGKGRRTVSRVLGWLRAGNDHLALVTNGKQWRLLFAGLDFEAWCEWDVDLWFQEGEPAPQVDALRTLLQPKLWTPESEDAAPPLLQAIRDTRKGQAELSETLGERVREAVEILIQGHGEALKELMDQCADVTSADIYRAACRVAMRLVVILFAEARDLLPRDNPVYHASYGLNGLLERLTAGGGGGHSLSRRFSAWPQVLALFNLVRDGSHLPQMPVRDYGGELFEAGRPDSDDGLSRALAVFETACFKQAVLPDYDVRRMLERMTHTKARIRQGWGGTWVTVPVDFSDLSSDYIGILYEGLLDYELKTAAPGEPVIFLAAGSCPALPLSRLKTMDDKGIKALFRNLKAKDTSADERVREESERPSAQNGCVDEASDVAGPLSVGTSDGAPVEHDERHVNRTRAETWARRATQVAGLFRKPRGKLTPERRRKAEEELARKAHNLVDRVVLPGEWYLVRWGGTRKGSGSFYTRPSLVVPTVRRTLQPLAYDPPTSDGGKLDRDVPATKWTPKPPERILDLNVCDPACGSGAFVLSALRFLTDALFASLQHHDRVNRDGERTMVHLLGISTGDRQLNEEMIPCPPDHDEFEPRLKAILRRHVVERCIYAVDFDPLAVELCRLSLWIETMDRNLPFGFLDHKVKRGNSLVGAWLDQFAHYPVMAWKNREGGDKKHTNGVHFKKGVWTKALKAFVKNKLKPDLARFLGGQDLFLGDPLRHHGYVHGQAQAVLERMHAFPVHDATTRARTYHEEFAGSAGWRSLKEAMDLWCACWFWPAAEIAWAPLPTSFTNPPEMTRQIARRISAENRFFHWELEFPDVFCENGSGFDAVLGNPPWDTAKPSSMEYFSNLDPLYRSYGHQEAMRHRSRYFRDHGGESTERDWLEYNARLRAHSNYVRYAARPFGAPDDSDKAQGRFAVVAGPRNIVLHRRWLQARRRGNGFADPEHPYQSQDSADLNLYKLFLEVAYRLLRTRKGGRLGFVVPSGLYSDYSTRALRDLFLEQSDWEWLLGIENRNKMFPIHRSYKFNPVVIEKGGTTKVIRTAFMRHDSDDWDQADDIAILYPSSLVERFSPRSRTLLEVRSQRDLDVLEKIYATGVPLGNATQDGNKTFRYETEFQMTGDSDLFPPRPEWKLRGYQADEYGRWLRGNWRPISELWVELRVDASSVTPASSRGRRPYHRLPIPRCQVPPGLILSLEGDRWIREEDVLDSAWPLYEGRMIGQFDYSQKSWISGKGRSAVWTAMPWGTPKRVAEPQFLMNPHHCDSTSRPRAKIAIMDVTSATNSRTMISTLLANVPCGHSIGIVEHGGDIEDAAHIVTVFNSWVYDFALRFRLSGLHASWFILEETPLLRSINPDIKARIDVLVERMTTTDVVISSPIRPELWSQECGNRQARTTHERLRIQIMLDVVIAACFGLSNEDLSYILRDCDYPLGQTSRTGMSDPKGFWRVDKNREPELRQTVLTMVAYHDLDTMIDSNGSRDMGMLEFMTQNDGEGWLVPQTCRLSDYGLGHDERAKYPQPVASRLGPRFCDWQLAQSHEEAWRECHLHARNLLGSDGYRTLLEDVAERAREQGHNNRCLLNDYTHSLVNDGGLTDDVATEGHLPLLQAAEPRVPYVASLFGTDDSS